MYVCICLCLFTQVCVCICELCIVFCVCVCVCAHTCVYVDRSGAGREDYITPVQWDTQIHNWSSSHLTS